MIDIHSHIVFDVDDGPKSLEESISLIEESYRQGVREIVSTSHRRKGMFETPEEKIYRNFCKVKEISEQKFDGLRLYYGGELYYTDDLLDKLKNHKVPSMNKTRYALIEFSMTTSWKEIYQGVTNVIMQGVTPIIAHIERYNVLAFDKKKVQELIDMGCYTQINSSHVLKVKLFRDKEKLFKRRAQYFLDKKLVHCIASDMHNLKDRKPCMSEAYAIVQKKYGTNMAKKLFIRNPKILLKNEEI